MQSCFFDLPLDAAVPPAATLPPALWRRREAAAAALTAAEAGGRLPAGLRALRFCCLFLAVCFGLIALATARPALPLALCGVCAAPGALLCIAAAVRRRRHRQTTLAPLQQTLAAVDKECLAALGAPADTAALDILCRLRTPADEAAPLPSLGDFVNIAYHAWAKDGRLYLCDGRQAFAFALADIGTPVRRGQRLLLPRWNKPLPPQHQSFAACRLTVGAGGVYTRAYYDAPLADGQVLRLAEYDIDAFCTLCGRTAADLT